MYVLSARGEQSEDEMPLFMDRHDVPGATAKEVADAHLSDLEVAAKHGVEFFSYWFDAEKGGVFCFAKANSRQNLVAVHEESHGLIPNEIIAVSEDDVLRFLGRIHDPVDATELTTPFRMILFTDLEGSTSILDEVGDSAFMDLLTEHDLIIRRALATWWGREVKHTGDGILASFVAVDQALECSLAIRDGFDDRNLPGGKHQLRVRIGMAAGRPVDHNDDIYGSTVNLADRLCDAAQPCHILVSDVVHDLGTKEGFAFDKGHERDLKGFPEPVRAFELLVSPSE